MKYDNLVEVADGEVCNLIVRIVLIGGHIIEDRGERLALNQVYPPTMDEAGMKESNFWMVVKNDYTGCLVEGDAILAVEFEGQEPS